MAGTLIITDNGATIGTVTVTAGQSTASLLVSGVSTLASHTVIATLTGGLSATTTYTAPASCTQPIGTKLTLDKMVNLRKAKLGDVLTYTLVLTL